MNILREIEDRAIRSIQHRVARLIEEAVLDFFYWNGRWPKTIFSYAGTCPPPGYKWFGVQINTNHPSQWWAVGDGPVGVPTGAVHYELNTKETA